MNRLSRFATQRTRFCARFSSTAAAAAAPTLERAQLAVHDFLAQVAQKQNLSIPEAQEAVAKLVSEGKVVHFDKNTSLQQVVFVQPEIVAERMSMAITPSSIGKSIEMETEHLEKLMKQFQPIAEKKISLDERALNIVYRNWRIFTGYLFAQMLFYMKLTWIDYGWDVTEPITYMTSFTVVLGSYIYFVVFRRDYTYNDLRNRMIAKKALKLYQKENFDHSQFDSLVQQIEASKQKLENGLNLLYGNKTWPERQHALLNQIQTVLHKPTKL